jgi:uncharacterized protein (TIGR02271 family)
VITREQIPTVLDHPVHDAEGAKIGDARHVFLDDTTGQPEWVSVKTGMFGGHESFVPIHDAALVGDHLEVPFAKELVKHAPHADVDAGGHLSEQEEHRLYDHYGIDWDGSRRTSGESAAGARAGTGMAAGAAGGTAAAGAAGAAGTREPAGEAGTSSDEASAARAADMRAREGRGRHRRDAERQADDAMTRSEERMHISTERRETGRARLRKYVVTEETDQVVPLRHEEVRVEREPITDANRDAATAGPPFTESEYEVTLHEDRPVIRTETVPVERVRLDTVERTDEEHVRGQVRKERIEVELPEEDRKPRE